MKIIKNPFVLVIMSVIPIKDQKLWNDFVQNNALDGGILQSWQWGEFQEALGRKVIRLALEDEDKNLQVLVLLTKLSLPLGQNILYIPRGPVFKKELLKTKQRTQEILVSLLDQIKKIAKQERSVFLRLDPAWTSPQDEFLSQLGLRKSSRNVQPKFTLVLDITKSPEEILAQMRPKTRYNIGLAKKKQVEIRRLSLDDQNRKGDLRAFWLLLKETAKRDEFRPHPEKYYQKMLEALGVKYEVPAEERAYKADVAQVELFLAEYQGKVIAANLVAFFNKWAYYFHGASSYTFRRLMAPYLAHWEAIQVAKKRGCHYYDFWGVAPDDGQSVQRDQDVAWQGITRFKTGFAPQEPLTSYVGAWELIYEPLLYKAYQLLKRMSLRL